ncbi:MAG: L-seryl-tRNA(Sec) selenium transferase [Acidobacteriota bacterium]|nr:MAG: L-seryl-tRNA(Sec) selenium transferase [Acidobacteriota bacterium]
MPAKHLSAKSLLRDLPSVDRLLSEKTVAALAEEYPRGRVKEAAREVLKDLRRAVREGRLDAGALRARLERLPQALRERLAGALRPSLLSVINATGVILHTNLGRAPLAEEAVEEVARAARSYAALEYDIASGRRGGRGAHVESLLCRMLEAEAAHIVNNNAAAVLLALNTLALGKEVVVSRGELIEIGGSFRIPEILARSGARMREVGTTNKTKPADYARAVSKETGTLLKVHPSNYRVVGFTESVELEELAAIARKKRIPLLYDLGSGHLAPLAGVGEPTVPEELRRGADVVCFSGDKLLGGPQAGVLAGKKRLVQAMKRNPLSRALRVDKMTLAALEATLALHYAGRLEKIPVLRMAGASREAIRKRARRLASRIAKVHPDWGVEVKDDASRIGGGTTPAMETPTAVVSLLHPSLSAQAAAERLRGAEPPVIARVRGGRVILDLRTVGREEEKKLEAALGRLA